MFDLIQQTDISDLANILAECPVLPALFISKFLQARGKTQSQIDTIVNQMVRKKYMFKDSSGTNYLASKGIRPCDIGTGRIKGLWLALALEKKGCLKEKYIQHDFPRVLSFMNNNTVDNDPFFDVFYIQYGDESVSLFSIQSKFKPTSTKPPHKVFIIVDDPSQVGKIELPKEYFTIYKYVLVAANGDVTFLDTD